MHRRHFAPGIAWFVLVAILLFIPASELPKPQTWLKKIFFDKWVHAFLFGFLAFLFMKGSFKAWPKSKLLSRIFVCIFIVCSAWGLATEFIQGNWIKGRGFEWLDWAADSTGALMALIYWLIILNKQPKPVE